MARSVEVTEHNRSGPIRKVVATEGHRYLVSPTNPKKMKHRGRTGVIQSLEVDILPSYAMMKFDDNKRVGKVDICDLVPFIEPAVKT